jgi:ATP-binding cassette subfamily F protein 2
LCCVFLHLANPCSLPPQLTYYSGNYDQYVKTRAEQEENQMKRYQSEQAQMADMKDYIARFGHGR